MAVDSLYVVDSLGMTQAIAMERPHFSIATLFVEGGTAGMLLITILLIALLIAAWKAPNWVKEIGIGALVVGAFWTLLGLRQAAEAVVMTGDISPVLVWSGIRVMSISFMYSLIVYFLSLIIRIIQKPRI